MHVNLQSAKTIAGYYSWYFLWAKYSPIVIEPPLVHPSYIDYTFILNDRQTGKHNKFQMLIETKQCKKITFTHQHTKFERWFVCTSLDALLCKCGFCPNILQGNRCCCSQWEILYSIEIESGIEWMCAQFITQYTQ